MPQTSKDEAGAKDPLGINDPEFKETLGQVLNNAEETEEAMKGLQEMMKILGGAIGEPGSAPVNDPKAEETLNKMLSDLGMKMPDIPD